jgi:uncharacterized repeat protein (TIGR03803 family)
VVKGNQLKWKVNNRCSASVAGAGNWQTLPAPIAAFHSRHNHRSKILWLARMALALVLAGQEFHANAQTETNIYSFGGQPDGGQPRAGLVQANDGNFYGTTYSGGTNGSGTVFRLTPGGGYTNLYPFGSQPFDGAYPSAGLIQGSDGYLYGTTVKGGTGNCGTVFRISLSGSYSNLYSFQGPTNDGYGPGVGLTRGNDGNLYGVTMGGGAGNFGTVFRFSTNGTETMLYSFAGSTNDGYEPLSALILGSDGNFYGTTFFGGITNVASIGFVDTLGLGTVFRISPGGSYQLLHLFGSTVPDGFAPGQLVQANDGNFYGVAFEGGTFTNHGAVFRITPGGSESLFYSFGSQPGDGSSPSSLIVGSDGNFYGTTTKGGTNDIGAVFRLSPGGSESVLYSFGSQPNDGNDPLGWLTQGAEGNFYGTTAKGGSGNGTIFQLTGALIYSTNQITQIRLVGTNVILGILSAPGDTYQLQSTTNLATADWSNVTGVSVTNSVGGLLNATNFGGSVGQQRFYRLSISP